MYNVQIILSTYSIISAWFIHLILTVENNKQIIIIYEVLLRGYTNFEDYFGEIM